MSFNKVFLIQPDYPGSNTNLPIWPLGLGYIAETLKSAGIAYEIVDLNFGYGLPAVIERIRKFAPDLIGFSLMTSRLKHLHSLIGSIKNVFPGIPIVAGGPHISVLREKALTDCPAIDFGVIGEGEETIVELCQGICPAKIKGLLYREGANIVFTGLRERIRDMDAIPFPTYSGFETARYDASAINILTSRGCPFQCIYCCVKSAMGRQWRARSPANLMREIMYWHGRGYWIFNLSDDAFNLNRERVVELCRNIAEAGLKIELNACNGMRADHADKKILELMWETGFRQIAFGVEAGTNKVLARMKKGETAEQIEDAIKNACELGYKVVLFFLIGLPGETQEDLEQSFRLAKKYPVVDIRFYNVVPFPNTELYDWLSANSYLVVPPEKYLDQNYSWLDQPIFFTPEMGIVERKAAFRRGEQLGKRLRRQVLRKYYRDGFRPMGPLANCLAWLTSSDLAQWLLHRSRSLRALRGALKERAVFVRKQP